MPVLLLYARREIMAGMGHVVNSVDHERFPMVVPSAKVVDVVANHYTVNTSETSVAAIRNFFGLD